MSLPSVAVVVLNWNGRHHLADCLTALRRQSYQGPWEVVLVDNGSSDDSVALVQRDFPEVQVVRSSVNLGFAAGNNLAVRQLDTELVALLNNDTRADPQWLAELVRSVTQAPDVAAAGGRILSWDGKRLDFGGGGATLTGFGLQFGFGGQVPEGEVDRDVLFACGGSMIVKRQPYLEVGGLDDDYFLYYEDVDLGWRLWLAGYRVRYAPLSIVFHRHGGSRPAEQDRLSFLYERNALYTVYKNYDDRHLAAILPAALLLAAERATILSGVDRRRFLPGQPRFQAPPDAATAGAARTAGARQKLRDSLERRGVRATLSRAANALLRRLASRARRSRTRLGGRIAGDRDALRVSALALSRLAALEAFGAALPALQAKREAAQHLRRRSDEEIIRLFAKPLDPPLADAEYIQYHHRLLEAMKLDRLVEVKPSRERPVSDT